MYKYLFVGCRMGNTGPGNVNKEITNALTSEFAYIHCRNKYCAFLETVLRAFFARVIVLSGESGLTYRAMKTARFLNKKTVFIMHGCGEYEIAASHFTVAGADDSIRKEREILSYVSMILAVSKPYADWLKSYYPKYAAKIGYLPNGVKPIQKAELTAGEKKAGYVAAAGGDWPLKNNRIVCEAIESLNGRATLRVYGNLCRPSECKSQKHTEYVGGLPNDQFLRALSESELFIVNSSVESFSISVFEALQCGCSILVSRGTGAASLLKLEDTDMIFDPQDDKEIREKVLYLLEHPNNKRILDKVSLDDLTYSDYVNKLRRFCKALEDGKHLR